MAQAASEEPLCLAIGQEEIRRYGGYREAIAAADSGTLINVVLTVIWAQVPEARPLIQQMDAALAQRAACV